MCCMSLLHCMKMRLAYACVSFVEFARVKRESFYWPLDDSEPVHDNGSSLQVTPSGILTDVPGIVTFPRLTTIQQESVFLRTSQSVTTVTVAWCIRYLMTSVENAAFHCEGETNRRRQFLLSSYGLGHPQSRFGRYGEENNNYSCWKEYRSIGRLA